MTWLRRLFARRCDHQWRGVANFYDRDHRAWLHLLACDKCHDTVIEVISA